jgi:hypothetical protein
MWSGHVDIFTNWLVDEGDPRPVGCRGCRLALPAMEPPAGGYGEQLVAVLSAAADLLADLPARVTRLTGTDLEVVLPVVDRLAALAGAGRYTLTADADQRGEIAASQAGTTAQWVADRCPCLDARDAALVAKAVRDLAGPDLAAAAAAVTAGRLSVPQQERRPSRCPCCLGPATQQLRRGAGSRTHRRSCGVEAWRRAGVREQSVTNAAYKPPATAR